MNNEVKIISMLTLLELPLDSEVSPNDINDQYKKLVKVYHPDVANNRYKDGKKFIELQHAKDYLLQNINEVNRTILRGFFSSNSSNSYYNQQEERRRQEAQQRAEEERRRQEAQKRAEEERRRQEAQQRAEEERRRQETQQRAEEERRRQEAQQRAEEEKKKQEAEDLLNIKNQSIKSLSKIYNAYSQADYSEQKWKRIEKYYVEYIEKIKVTNFKENIETYISEFTKNISNIPTLKAEQISFKKKRRTTIIAVAISIILFITGIVTCIIEFGLKSKLTIYDEYGDVIYSARYFNGNTIDLNSNIVEKDNYFLEGFYSDASLSKRITEVKISNGKSVYTKWKLKGAGTLNNEFLIYDQRQLFDYCSTTARYKLMSDIVISPDYASKYVVFSGNLNGNGYTIKCTQDLTDTIFDKITADSTVSNLNFSLNNIEYRGTKQFDSILFGENYGSIKNISVSASDVDLIYNNVSQDDRYISVVVAKNYGTIYNVSLEGKYKLVNSDRSNLFLSGICGCNYSGGNISKSINKADLTGRDTSGICSLNKGKIDSCTNKGYIKSSFDQTDYSAVAVGICQINESIINDSSNEGIVDAAGNSNSGASSAGISYVNEKNAKITNCFNKGEIIVSGKVVSDYIKIYAAGVVIANSGTVEGSYNEGSFQAKNTTKTVMIGGVVNTNDGTVYSCWNENKTYSFSKVGNVEIGCVVGINHEKGSIDYCANFYINDSALSTIYNSTEISCIGGICSRNYGKITRTWNNDVLSWNSNYCCFVAGIASYNYSTGIIENSYNASWLKANDSSSSYGSRVGGITCQNDGTINYCFNRASTSCGNNDWNGAIVSKGTGIVQNCLWVYFANNAENANDETDNDIGAVKCNDDADLLVNASTLYDSSIWDFTNNYPMIKND